MNKKIILIIALCLALIGIISAIYFNFSEQNITGAATINYYSFTKAICNKTNYCQDYEIICDRDKIISKKPITGAAIQYPENWQDSRNNEMIEKTC